MSTIVPQVNMDQAPIVGFAEFEAHLDQLQKDPTIPVNGKIIDDVSFQLTPTNIPALLPSILPIATDIIKSTTQDTTSLLLLTIKLLSPLSFTQLLDIADAPTIVSALRSPLPGANLLGLAIIHKAAASPSDVTTLSGLPEVLTELVTVWLETSHTGVAGKAETVIGDILDTDCSKAPRAQVNGFRNEVQNRDQREGDGKVWDLLFSTRGCLSLIVEGCKLSRDKDERQVTTSQGRLLSILPRLATIYLEPLIKTDFEALFPASDDVGAQLGNGLFQWAAMGMVDTDDALMHVTLIAFFLEFVRVMRFEGRSINAGEESFLTELTRLACNRDQRLDHEMKLEQQRLAEQGL